MRAKCLAASLVVLAACGALPGASGDDVPPPSGTPVVGFDEMTSSYDETDGELTLYMHLSEPTNELVTFSLELGGTATNGRDYDIYGSGIVVIPPGVDLAWTTIRLIDDGVPEPAETIELAMSMPVHCTLGLAHHTLTIRDNTKPRITFEHPASGADEFAPGSVNILVMPASQVPITVDYTLGGTATPGVDYGLQDGTITIPSGVTTFPFALNQIDDVLDEDNETIIVTLSNPKNAIFGLYPKYTHTIGDNEDEPNVGFVGSDQTVLEGDSGIQVLTAEIRLDAVSGRTVSVPFGPGDPQYFSATLGVDYTISTPSPLVFPPGTTSQTITFAILGDTVQDGSDRLALTLQSSLQAYVNSYDRRIVQIDNDDCIGPAGWHVCPDTAPTTDLTLDSTNYFSTTFDGSSPCALRQPPGWIESGQPSACFIVARNITIGTAKFSGFRPVVLVALDSITVNTLLDAGSHILPSAIGVDGAGPNPVGCAAPPASDLHLGAGGAGGSFMTAGGNGGNHGPADPGGTGQPAVSAPTVLRGGCSAQQPEGNKTGHGGGAVYLLAANQITVGPNAVINASGAGGDAGRVYAGGDGGGSGGMIVLWAQSIMAAQAHLLANGGGGGEGAEGGTQNAIAGTDPNPASMFTPALGGSGSQGGDGGAGAVQGVSAVAGSNASAAKGAGGGGGGLGYILVHGSLSNAVSSPTPATF